MNLFDKLVNEAIKTQPDISPLRNIVEKELLHHDILRMMSSNGLLKDLTFMGGTALRICYGAVRLSEDLDFTGGFNFSRDNLVKLGEVIKNNLYEKYGFNVDISEPNKDTTNVDTWKIKIETRPESKNLPAQRINIDICVLPSYEAKPILIRNPYGVNMGTSGLIIKAQSLEEIYIDKVIAFALRPNRIKYRDIWDLIWLYQQNIEPHWNLVTKKIADRSLSANCFKELFQGRYELIATNANIEKEFQKEMERFLPYKIYNETVKQQGLWEFFISLIHSYMRELNKILSKS